MLHGNQILDLYQGEAAIIEDPLHLLTAGLCPVIDGVDRFRCVLNGLSTQHLKQFALRVFADDSITLPFLTLPASRNHHHSFPGGLLCHSLECVDLVAGLAITMSQERRELGMVAALLHDIGKVSTHHHKAKTKLVGAILHHDALTLEILAPQLLHLDSISSESAVALRYLLTWDKTGYSRRPLMVLAEAVAAADRISSGANAEKQAFSESEHWRRLQSWHGSRYWRPNLSEILKGA